MGKRNQRGNLQGGGGASGDSIVRQRVGKLLELARESLDSDAEGSRSLVALARRLAMRHRVKLGSRLFCKKCGTLFVAGKTFKARVEKRRAVWACINCGSKRAVGALKPKKARAPARAAKEAAPKRL
ncbi:MAG: hypothetical protein WC792_00960 [Candidatus Micrarchaeia archaeon]|jgi:RNase P subunit RPR2